MKLVVEINEKDTPHLYNMLAKMEREIGWYGSAYMPKFSKEASEELSSGVDKAWLEFINDFAKSIKDKKKKMNTILGQKYIIIGQITYADQEIRLLEFPDAEFPTKPYGIFHTDEDDELGYQTYGSKSDAENRFAAMSIALLGEEEVSL